MADSATFALKPIFNKRMTLIPHFISTGIRAPDPVDVLGSNKMHKLITELEQDYELLIIDTPPISAVSDARVLASKVGGTIVVIKWADTNRKYALDCLNKITESGGRLLGAVLAIVDVKQHAGYGYADSGYYYGKNRKYYHSEKS